MELFAFGGEDIFLEFGVSLDQLVHWFRLLRCADAALFRVAYGPAWRWDGQGSEEDRDRRRTGRYIVFMGDALLYEKVEEVLAAEIAGGELQPGDRLQSEDELLVRFGVSRITVRRAIQNLVQRGVVEIQRGRGTFVLAPRISQELTKLTGFVEDMMAHGRRASAKVLSRSEVAANATVARQLGISKGTRVVRIERVRLADSVPMSLDETYLPLAIGRQIVRNDLRVKPIFTLLEEKYGVPLAEAEYKLEASAASAHVAEALAIAEGAPIFRIERTTFTTGGEPIDYEMLSYRGRSDPVCHAIDAEIKKIDASVGGLVFPLLQGIAPGVDGPWGGSAQSESQKTSDIEQVAFIAGRAELCAAVDDACELDGTEAVGEMHGDDGDGEQDDGGNADERDEGAKQDGDAAEDLGGDGEPCHEVSGRNSGGVQDAGECFRAFGPLGEAVCEKAVADEEPERKHCVARGKIAERAIVRQQRLVCPVHCRSSIAARVLTGAVG